MITVDSNQDSQMPDLADYLEEETKVTIQPLDTGDLAFRGRGKEGTLNLRIGGEIKVSPGDVVASLNDKRIPNQLIRMVNEFDIPYLFIVGQDDKINFETGKIIRRGKGGFRDSAWNYHYYQSMLTRFEAAGGKIRKVRDTEHLAALVLSLYTYWRKDDHEKEFFVGTRDFSGGEEENKKISWGAITDDYAQVLWRMGIGPNRALALSKLCPSLDKLMLLPVEVIKELPVEMPSGTRKFGKKNAEKLYEFLHEPHGEGGMEFEFPIINSTNNSETP